jgi:hypothetical protein
MNLTRSRPPLLCHSARGSDPRRKPPLPPGCSVDCHHRPPNRSWADAATPAQPLETLPAQARDKGATLAKSSAPPGKDNPLAVTSSYRTVCGSVAAGTQGRPGALIPLRIACAGARAALMALPRAQTAILAGWLGGLIARAGEIIFAACDEEAGWRGWSIGRPHGGLTRVYRDPAFDLIVHCPQCRGLGTAPGGAECGPCSGTGRLVLDQPPIASNG